MKMNRTEWIVVILCAAVLGWIFTRPPAQKPAEKTPDKPAAAETKPADPSKPPDPAKPADPATTPAPATPPPAPDVPEESYAFDLSTAKYTFTNKGGGLKQVDIKPAQYSGKTPETLNGKFLDEKKNPLAQR